MTTQFAAAVSGIKALLEGAPAVCAHVERGRTLPLPADWNEMVNIRLDTSTREPVAIYGAPQDWETEIQIVCHARAKNATPDELIDALVLAVANRIEPNKGLGNLAMDFNLIRIDWDFSENGDNTAAATLNYTLQHRTAAQSLE